MATSNCTVKKEFTQACVIHGVSVEKEDVVNFETFFLERCKARIQFLETYYTLPDIENGKAVTETGDRADVIFVIHDDDLDKVTLADRHELGIRWLEDAIANDPDIYEARISEYLK